MCTNCALCMEAVILSGSWPKFALGRLKCPPVGWESVCRESTGPCSTLTNTAHLPLRTHQREDAVGQSHRLGLARP